MDTKQIVELLVNAVDLEKDALHKQFQDELRRLADAAKEAADRGHGSLMTLAWLETSMTRLREIRGAVDRTECKRVMLHRVADAAALSQSSQEGLITRGLGQHQPGTGLLDFAGRPLGSRSDTSQTTK